MTQGATSRGSRPAHNPTMPEPLPAPASTTEVYLAAVVARLDALLEAIAPPPTAPRKRTPRKATAEEA